MVLRLSLRVGVQSESGACISKARGERLHLGGNISAVQQHLGNGWSKSIVLEDKVVSNFVFRLGAKKSGHLDYPLQNVSFRKCDFSGT